MDVETIEKNEKINGGKPNLEDYEKVYNDFDWKSVEDNFSWKETGKVNMAYECIDKHVEEGNGDKIALRYLDADEREEMTFKDLKVLSNRFANVLKNLGAEKGDRVFIFMPRNPKLYVSFLGILKAGCIAGPLFEAFMEEAVKDRMLDAGAKFLVTTPDMLKRIPRVDLPELEKIILVGRKEHLEEGEYDFDKEMEKVSDEFEIEWVDRETPMLLHYTSGSTGKPKGVVHVHNAMIGHYVTGKYVLDLKPDDVYWCTADPGWVTGTSYGMFAPWLNCVGTLIRGGRFSVDGWYSTLQDYKVTIWYSAPTAFRLLMAKDNEKSKDYDFSSLRLIYSVGEPLNPEVIRWSMDSFGLPIHDTWWMTETGMQLIANYPSMPIRLGSMGRPLPGVQAAIVDDEGEEVAPNTIGNLAIKAGWPSMMRTIWKNKEKYKSYFEKEPWYISGDSAHMDEDGYFWFHGRIDDVIMSAGERIGPFEVESRLVEHPAVAEAGVIGKPDDVRGEIVKAFVQLRDGYEPSDELKADITNFVKTGLAAHAKPREIEFMDKLPKTRSGKIMRRVLKSKELGLPTGDLSTMAD